MTRHGKPLVALVSAADLERLAELDGEGVEAEEQVISSVSSIPSAAPAAPGGSQRFGIAAEHRGQGDPGA